MENFIRKCSTCDIEVEFNSKRAYSISLNSICYCCKCRKRRFARKCPTCDLDIYVSSLSRSKRFEGKNCKRCESLIRITEKRGFGFSGTYNNYFFRSSTELSFMINENRKWISGELQIYAIQYFINGKEHTYYPDFIVENEVIEIKPKYAQKGEIFEAKKNAAIQWCNNKNMIYKVIDSPPIHKSKLLEMHNNGIISLTPKTFSICNS